MLVAATTLRMPILIWVPHPDGHALPSALQVASTLREAGRRCELVYGDQAFDKVITRIKQFVTVADTVKRLRHSRVGLMDYRASPLISGAHDDIQLLIDLGINIIQINMLEILSAYNNVPYSQIEPLARDIIKRVDLVEATEEDVERATQLYTALKELVERYKLDAVAVRGYPEFDDTGTSATLACGILNDEGIMANYEGDVVSAINMLILNLISGKPVFLAEPYKINEEKGTLLFFHRSAPLSLVESSSRVSLYGPQMHMKVPLKMDTATIARLGGKGLKKLHASIGTVIPQGQETEAITKIEVKLREDPRIFLVNALGNHYSIVSGDHLEELRIFCDLMEINMIEP